MKAIAGDDEALMLGALVTAIEASPDIAEVTKFSNCNEALDFAKENLYRLTQLEQQVVNMICYPDIKLLHPKAMVCSYDYKTYRTEEDYKEDNYYSAEIVSEALKNPIQLHYAGAYKPWNVIFGTKAGVWWKELLRQRDVGLIFATFRIVIKEKKYLNRWKDWIRKMIVKNSFFSFCYKCFKKIFH